MIVCIPTKGRPKTTTYKLFEEANIPVYHFIEPQELKYYDVPNMISIEQDNQGIAYVRNYILEWARNNNHETIILCDDDVNGFGIYNGKTIKKDAGIWQDIYEMTKDLPYEMIGINYTQHAWHEKTDYSINKKFVEVCVMIKPMKIKWSYRGEFNLKEDRDFSLQTIKYGYGILRFNKYWFSCPNVGTNTGGLQNEYKEKKDEYAAKKMCYEWHPYIKLQTKGNRVDMKTDIKGLATHYKKYVK